LIYSSPFFHFAFKSPVGLRAQEGSHLAIGASKAPVAVFERARSQEEGKRRRVPSGHRRLKPPSLSLNARTPKKKVKEEGSHLAIGAFKAPVAVFEVNMFYHF
jgi:hypothetical protein